MLDFYSFFLISFHYFYNFYKRAKEWGKKMKKKIYMLLILYGFFPYGMRSNGMNYAEAIEHNA